MKVEDALFSRLVLRLLRNDKIPKLFEKLYLGHTAFFNYAFVAGVIGTIVSYIIYHSLMYVIWEPAAYWLAIIITGLGSNYFFSIGRGGRIFGLEVVKRSE